MLYETHHKNMYGPIPFHIHYHRRQNCTHPLRRTVVRQEVCELCQQVAVVPEEHRYFIIDFSDALLAFTIHVEDLQEDLVNTLIGGKACLQVAASIDRVFAACSHKP